MSSSNALNNSRLSKQAADRQVITLKETALQDEGIAVFCCLRVSGSDGKKLGLNHPGNTFEEFSMIQSRRFIIHCAVKGEK